MLNIELTTATGTTNHTTAIHGTKTKLTIADNTINKMETCRSRSIVNNLSLVVYRKMGKVFHWFCHKSLY